MAEAPNVRFFADHLPFFSRRCQPSLSLANHEGTRAYRGKVQDLTFSKRMRLEPVYCRPSLRCGPAPPKAKLRGLPSRLFLLFFLSLQFISLLLLSFRKSFFTAFSSALCLSLLPSQLLVAVLNFKSHWKGSCRQKSCLTNCKVRRSDPLPRAPNNCHGRNEVEGKKANVAQSSSQKRQVQNSVLYSKYCGQI